MVENVIKLGCKNADALLIGLLRQVKGRKFCFNECNENLAGSRSEENLNLIEFIVRTLNDNPEWIRVRPGVAPYLVYPLLRFLAEDKIPADIVHVAANLTVDLLSSYFKECSTLGRELVRCLIEVAKYPVFEKIWRTILSPSLDSGHALMKLLMTPSAKKFVVLRISPQIEGYVNFLVANVPSGQLLPHFALFTEDFNGRGQEIESFGTFVSDFIRFLTVGIHPSNAQLSAGYVSRWYIIFSILKLLHTSYEGATAKLALFLDWITFDGKGDNIMLIEPAALLIFRSAPLNVSYTITLLEFLQNLPDTLYPPLHDLVASSIKSALEACVKLGVVPSLDVLLSSPLLPEDLKMFIRNLH